MISQTSDDLDLVLERHTGNLERCISSQPSRRLKNIKLVAFKTRDDFSARRHDIMQCGRYTQKLVTYWCDTGNTHFKATKRLTVEFACEFALLCGFEKFGKKGGMGGGKGKGKGGTGNEPGGMGPGGKEGPPPEGSPVGLALSDSEKEVENEVDDSEHVAKVRFATHRKMKRTDGRMNAAW